MLDRLFTHKICSPEHFKPIDDRLKVVGAFNPAVIPHDDHIVMIVRIAETFKEQKKDHIATPVWKDGQLHCEWAHYLDDVADDPRTVVNRQGRVRLRFVSHLRVVHLDKSGKHIESYGPMIMPETDYEIFGVEDPRVTKVDDVYYITYVGVSLRGICTALITTKDFKTFKREGIIFAPDNKDVLIFPEKHNGNFMALHRPAGTMRFSNPEMWYADSPDMIHWGNHRWMWSPSDSWQAGRIGGGAPPFLTDEGWVEIYHGATQPDGPHKPGVYRASLMLLDKDDPARVIGMSDGPFMHPEEDWEKAGYVDHVVFPTAAFPALDDENTLLVYYGAADEHCAVTAYKKDDLVSLIKPMK